MVALVTGGRKGIGRSAALNLAREGADLVILNPKVIAHDPKFKYKYLERMPMGRFAQPEEIGPSVVFLASGESGYITGQTLCIDGGMVML